MGGFVRKPLIAGNWKMNLDHLEAANFVQKLSWKLQDLGHDFSEVEVVVFPPFTDLRTVDVLVKSEKFALKFGGQDLSEHDFGAYTGQVSGKFLQRLNCEYVLVGHSERRLFNGETDAVVNAKVCVALQSGLAPILCVGEDLAVRKAGEHVDFTVAQLCKGLQNVSAEDLGKVVVAYEPVWAIGTGEVATAFDAQEMCLALRAQLAKLYSFELADKVRILYGGSVKAANAQIILSEKDVDGALVGGASLDVEEFANIVRFEH